MFRLDGFQSNEETRDRIAREFGCSRLETNSFIGCVGAMDGIAVAITKTIPSNYANTAVSYHMKGYYAQTVLELYNTRYRFMFFFAKCCGPTQDSVTFSVQAYVQILRNGDLTEDYWIVRNDAYVCVRISLLHYQRRMLNPVLMVLYLASYNQVIAYILNSHSG